MPSRRRRQREMSAGRLRYFAPPPPLPERLALAIAAAATHAMPPLPPPRWPQRCAAAFRSVAHFATAMPYCALFAEPQLFAAARAVAGAPPLIACALRHFALPLRAFRRYSSAPALRFAPRSPRYYADEFSPSRRRRQAAEPFPPPLQQQIYDTPISRDAFSAAFDAATPISRFFSSRRQPFRQMPPDGQMTPARCRDAAADATSRRRCTAPPASPREVVIFLSAPVSVRLLDISENCQPPPPRRFHRLCRASRRRRRRIDVITPRAASQRQDYFRRRHVMLSPPRRDYAAMAAATIFHAARPPTLEFTISGFRRHAASIFR